MQGGKYTMNQSKDKLLQQSLTKPNSEVYFRKNWKKIKKYFWKKNIKLTKAEI